MLIFREKYVTLQTACHGEQAGQFCSSTEFGALYLMTVIHLYTIQLTDED